MTRGPCRTHQEARLQGIDTLSSREPTSRRVTTRDGFPEGSPGTLWVVGSGEPDTQRHPKSLRPHPPPRTVLQGNPTDLHCPSRVRIDRHPRRPRGTPLPSPPTPNLASEVRRLATPTQDDTGVSGGSGRVGPRGTDVHPFSLSGLDGSEPGHGRTRGQGHRTPCAAETRDPVRVLLTGGDWGRTPTREPDPFRPQTLSDRQPEPSERRSTLTVDRP